MRGGIEFANRIGFIAEELDTQRAVGLGRVNVEDAAAHRVLAGHFDHVGGSVADGVEMREQGLEIKRFAAADGAGEIGIIIAGAQADSGGRDWRDHDRCRSGGDLP